MFALAARSSSRDASSNEPLPPPFPNVMELSGTVLEAVTSEAVGAYGVEVGGADDFLVEMEQCFSLAGACKDSFAAAKPRVRDGKGGGNGCFSMGATCSNGNGDPDVYPHSGKLKVLRRVCVLTWTPYDLTDCLT